MNAVVDRLVDINIVKLVILFRRRVQGFLCAINTGRHAQTIVHHFNVISSISCRTRRSILPVIVTYGGVSHRGINTLVIVRHSIDLTSIMSANRALSTVVGRQLVRGVFFGGSPLRSNTVVVSGGEVGTTKYVLPISRSLDVPHRLNLERHTTVNVSRRSSTVTVTISRRANHVAVIIGNRVAINVAPRALRDFLAKD